MRHGPLIAIALLVMLPSTGCMVLDEVDAANAQMSGRKKAAAPASTSAQAPSQQATGAHSVLEESKKWWKRASSLAPKEIDSSIVECRLHGSAQFMAKDDCLSRGGEPRSASG